jgi:hypothetical protein
VGEHRKREQPVGWVPHRLDVVGWLQHPVDVVEDAAAAVPEGVGRRRLRLAEGWMRVWAWDTPEGYGAGHAPVAVALCLARVEVVWAVGAVPVLTCVQCAGRCWYVAMACDDVLLVMGLLT